MKTGYNYTYLKVANWQVVSISTSLFAYHKRKVNFIKCLKHLVAYSVPARTCSHSMRARIGLAHMINLMLLNFNELRFVTSHYNLTNLRSFLTILDADLVIVMIVDRKSYLNLIESVGLICVSFTCSVRQ